MDATTLALVAGQIYSTLLSKHGIDIDEDEKAELHAMAIDDAAVLVAEAERRAASPRTGQDNRGPSILPLALLRAR